MLEIRVGWAVCGQGEGTEQDAELMLLMGAGRGKGRREGWYLSLRRRGYGTECKQ